MKKNDIPDYSRMERAQVPQELTWKAGDIYRDFDAWQADKKRVAGWIDQIEDLGRDWTSSPGKALALLTQIDEIDKIISRLYVYTNLFADTDMGHPAFQAMKGEIQVLNVDFQARLSFLRPDVLAMGQEKIDAFLTAEKKLAVYRLFFDSVLRLKDHILGAAMEEISSLTGLFSTGPEKASLMLNNVEMPFASVRLSDGRQVELNQTNYVRYRESRQPEDRRKVMRAYWKKHTLFKNTHAILLDAEIKSHYFQARVHRYDDCLKAALYPNNIDVQVYRNLIETVKENLDPLYRYLRLKTTLLDLDKLSYNDIYASAVPTVDRVFTLEEGESLVIEALRPLGNEYTTVLREGFKNRWLDIYPNKGKRSGAYSSGSIYDVHPYVLLNYNGTFDAVSTLAHELGHALHSYFSNRSQPYPLAAYPIFLAEIASTFNEALLVEHVLASQTDDWFRLYILDQYLEGLRGTLIRQALFAEFELAMHGQVEKGKTLTHEWLDEKYLELTREYYGHPGIMDVPPYIANEWSAVPHFYYNFYVYQYSTGIIAAIALSQGVLDGVLAGDDRQRREYLDFLKAGGSDYPLATLKKAGVDLTTQKPIMAAIAKFDRLVNAMSVLNAKLSGARDKK